MTTTEENAIELPHSDAVSLAVKEILMTACGTVAEQCEDLGEEMFHEGVIISVISVMGGVEWSIFLGLPRSTATAMAEGFAGFAIPFESEDMGDAVGEVTNILAGNVKQILDKRGVNIEISLPSVFRADGLHILKQRNSQASRICYTTSMGPLWTGVIAGCDAGVVA
ncbi:MAG: chemotaxis protein CheX [Phycisphaerae bacterium]|nr:chemotaxis protein CheX [Phycisphaerae bacterium]